MDNNGFVGTGTTITFGTSAIALSVKDISWSGIGQKEKIDVSDLSSTSWKEFIATKLNDPGSITLECNYDPDIDPTTALTTSSETVTITWPIRAAANATNGTWVASGFMASYEPSGVNNDDGATVSVTVEVLGSITVTAETT